MLGEVESRTSVMCAMYMMCKTGTVCIRVADPHFIFELIGVFTIQKHMCCLLLEYLVIDLKQVLNLCPIPLLPHLLSGGEM